MRQCQAKRNRYLTPISPDFPQLIALAVAGVAGQKVGGGGFVRVGGAGADQFWAQMALRTVKAHHAGGWV
ncbi:MAG: hypothetical protein KA775_02885, partial [Ottowia sp.]|nr:hypothetical protein [Ottowia sp.]